MSYEQTIVSSAPGRAGIIGNPTDMYGGSVLSCSVGMRATVEISPHEQLVLDSNGDTCIVRTREDLRPQHDVFDVARAVLDYLRLPPLRCKISYKSQIPLRSGLAGSTALVVALLQGMLTWMGQRPPYYRLAEMARYVELHHLKVVCGYQDAYMCTFGGINYMDFRGKQFYREEEAELFATIEPISAYVAQLPFLLGFTGVQHSSGAVHKPLRERWLEGDPPVVQGYRRITEIARLGKKALLLEDWTALGELMNENHAIQRDLGGSGEANEKLIAAALQAGAVGAKLAGAGDGGTIIALWPHEDRNPLIEALQQAGAHTAYPLDVQPGAAIETIGV
jgi:galactokinase/mevalonate kinase-like predicted kinase